MVTMCLPNNNNNDDDDDDGDNNNNSGQFYSAVSIVS